VRSKHLVEASAVKGKVIGSFNALLMAILILFWGSSFVVVKAVLNEGLTPIAIATFRFLVAGGFFLLFLLLRKIKNRHYRLRVERNDVPNLVALSLLGITFFFAAQYTGIQMAGPSIAAILVCLVSPILITTLSARMFGEHLSKRQILGVGVAAAGTLIVIAGGTLSFSGSSPLVGGLILLSTPFLWAAYSLLGKKVMERNDAFLVVAYVNVLGGLFLVPFSAAEGSLGQALTMSINSWASILCLALTCSVLGYYIWFHVLKNVEAAAASSFLFAEPLITVMLAVAFVNEQLNWLTLCGGLLIFAGVYLVTKKQGK